uniref:Apple domain-containing protein n=1 Tax=Zooxanthella nutricula TaxID=1333877 RepID=A0A6U6PFS2_9DINO
MALGSKMASALSGAAAAQMFASAWLLLGAPSSRAAWGWDCTVYTGGSSLGKTSMAPGATSGPSCANGSALTCDCPVSPCQGMNKALPSDLTCAGAGDDNATCFKLHHTYGTAPGALMAVAGAGRPGAQLAESCGDAEVIKVYGNADGLDMLVSWGTLNASHIEKNGAPDNETACQALCAAHGNCTHFTYNDQGFTDPNYGYFSKLCFLQKTLACEGAAYTGHHGAISGPAVCDPVTVDVGSHAPRAVPVAAPLAFVLAAARFGA